MRPPEYFNRVAASAVELWNKLKDPVLAGPWRQLFSQVQSPRHVLSELLQNADDAGAKSASVRVVNNEFIFEHDGEDFTEEQFQSLCRFGYSNKRNLHTIGFRGVGFKSTFSLGNRVRIQTPKLDLVFERERFTLPIWSDNAVATSRTRISVLFADNLRLKQLRMNLEEWATSPVSLLFFRNLQELKVESHLIRKEILGRGPIAGSQKIRLTGASTEDLLLIRSDQEAFPEEVVNEIQQERNADDLHLPPCSVEVVLGLDGEQRLFVVLPSGTDVKLPFSINAPFLQDPARQRIKEPEVSPCNRWLLERAGKLAGEAMAAWLAKENLSMENRSGAYELLRGPMPEAADLTTSASKQVLEAMTACVQDKPILLTAEGKLAPIGECTALPKILHEIWESKELSTVFAPAADNLLASQVSTYGINALKAHSWIQTVSPETALEALSQRSNVEKPSSWFKLQLLWEWVELNIGWDHSGERRQAFRIVPVEGQKILERADGVIRVSSRGQQLSEADWNFISDFAPAIDQGWIAHLNKLKTKDDDEHPALELLKAIELNEPSQVDHIAAQASRRLFGRDKISMEDCVRIAHIFAALDATVPDDFRYVTEDRKVRSVGNQIIFDTNGEVESLVPKVWADQHLLHPDYVQKFASCSEERWLEWACSTKSNLHAFIPIISQPKRLWGRAELAALLKERDGRPPHEFRYRNDSFVVDDHDFPPDIICHWKKISSSDPKLWARVVRGLILDPLAGWPNLLSVSVRQISAQGTSGWLNCGEVLPGWLSFFKSVPCLEDTHGNLRSPADLLLRTPETEALLNIEPFVSADLDDTPEKKELLRLLGVRDSATSWEKVVDRLRGLAKIKDTTRVLADLLRFYEALDRIYLRCSPEDQNNLRAVFSDEALVLSNSLEWFSSSELSLHADPDDDAPVVHSAAHSLALWLRLGVPERPALEKSLEWLKTLKAGTRLDGASYKRAHLALARGGRRVWEELGHWLSLNQTWEAVTTLKYRLSKTNWTPWEKLTAPTKRAAADLRMLHGDVSEASPFTVAQPLAEVIILQVTNVQSIGGKTRRVEWLQPLADGLSRVKLADETITANVREVARRLLITTWQTVSRLEVTPYIDGTPVGEPMLPKVLWSETKLYTADQSTVRLYRELKEELARPFGESSVMEAVAHCIDRDAEFVREYLAANFDLDAQAELPQDNEELKPTDKAPKDSESTVENESDDNDAEIDSEENAAETESTDDETQDEQSSEATAEKPEKSTKPKEPTFMDRYAKARGFRWHEEERCYTHANGGWIEKGEAPFNWQQRTNKAELLKRLFVAEESLARGVEIPYELWRLMEINPDSIALVLCTEDGEPKEWSATELQQLKTDGQIRVHQSRFILREATI